MRKRGEMTKMNQPEVRLEELLDEIAYGDVVLTVVNKKLFGVPKQRIERPKKLGIRVDITIDEPLRIKQASQI